MLSSCQLTCVSIRADWKPKAPGNALPRGRYYKGHGTVGKSFIAWLKLQFFFSILKPGFNIVFVGLTVLRKTVKDRERPNGNTTEISAKTVHDPYRTAKTESLRVAEIDKFYSSDPERASAIVKDWQKLSKPRDPYRPWKSHKDYI